jgi:hypothetical protein
MIVNNATNINKSLKPLNLKKTMIYGVENSGPSLGHAHKCGLLIPNHTLLITGSPMVTHKQTIRKSAQIRVHSERAPQKNHKK